MKHDTRKLEVADLLTVSRVSGES